jgi:hypothetical protein
VLIANIRTRFKTIIVNAIARNLFAGWFAFFANHNCAINVSPAEIIAKDTRSSIVTWNVN